MLLYPTWIGNLIFFILLLGEGMQVEGVDEKCKGSGACSGYE
jgi:hypothetical protein